MEKRCPSCKINSTKTGYKTVLMNLRYEKLKDLNDAGYLFCPNPKCDMVYFSEDYTHVFRKDDLRVEVGIKESGVTRTLCYCFDIKEKDLINNLNLNKHNDIIDFISLKIRDKLCACSIKNPSGRCCLGTVKNVVNKLDQANYD